MCKIGVIDSGAGGISTLCAIMRLLPDEDYIYVSDRSHSPYGGRSADFIYSRISEICLMLNKMGAVAAVIACNTATAAGIEQLRANPDLSNIIFVGVEPAIKPAIEELKHGKALILLTPSAARQPKFVSLLKRFPPEKLIISPQADLAALIENNTSNLSAIHKDIYKMLSPLKCPDIESVVLGCTHYCLIRQQIGEIFGAKIYDGNAGAAVRLYSVLKQNKLLSRGCGGGVKFIML